MVLLFFFFLSQPVWYLLDFHKCKNAFKTYCTHQGKWLFVYNEKTILKSASRRIFLRISDEVVFKMITWPNILYCSIYVIVVQVGNNIDVKSKSFLPLATFSSIWLQTRFEIKSFKFSNAIKSFRVSCTIRIINCLKKIKIIHTLKNAIIQTLNTIKLPFFNFI